MTDPRLPATPIPGGAIGRAIVDAPRAAATRAGADRAAATQAFTPAPVARIANR